LCCVCLSLVVSTTAIDCLERLEMTCYVSSGTLNPTHSLTRHNIDDYRCCNCVQERRSSLKQASLAGYTICPVERRRSSSTNVVYSQLSARCSAVVDLASSDVTTSALCYDSDVQLLPPQSCSNSTANRVANSKAIPNPSPSPSPSLCQLSSPQSVRSRRSSCSVDKRRTSTSCVADRRETVDDDSVDCEPRTGHVSTADICNCSPSFGARQPGLSASRRHSVKPASTTVRRATTAEAVPLSYDTLFTVASSQV